MRFFSCALLLALLAGCTTRNEVRFDGETMGTFYAVTYLDESGNNHQEGIDSVLEHMNHLFSTYRENSVITRVNAGEDKTAADKAFIDVLKAALRVAEQTNGAFEPTILPLIHLWGFGGGERQNPDSAKVDSVRNLVDYSKVRVEDHTVTFESPEMELDLNALAKGYSVDQMGQYLEAQGITDYLVGIGGDMRARGKNASGEYWRIGIEEPIEDAEVGAGILEIIHLENESMATSGDYRNFYYEDGQKFMHIIDPQTGYPAGSKVLSATILHESCMKADALATASIAMGIDNAVQHLQSLGDIPYLLVTESPSGEYQLHTSSSMDAKIE